MVRIVFILFTVALTTASAVPLNPCVIRIQSFKYNGEVLRMAFETKLRSEQECSTLARMHQTNFSRNTVKSKKVSYIFGGSLNSKEQIASRERVKSRR